MLLPHTLLMPCMFSAVYYYYFSYLRSFRKKIKTRIKSYNNVFNQNKLIGASGCGKIYICLGLNGYYSQI